MKIIKSNERFYLFADKLEGSGTNVLNSHRRDKSRRNSFENRTSRGTKKTDNRKDISLLCFLPPHDSPIFAKFTLLKKFLFKTPLPRRRETQISFPAGQ